MINHLRRDAETIFRAAVAAVDPIAAVHRALRLESNKDICLQNLRQPLPKGRLFVIAAGKAAAPMAAAIEEQLGEWIDSGLAVTKDGHETPLKTIELLQASHPVPDQRSQYAAQKILDLLRQTTAEDLVITLISGGGSALLASPAAGLTLADKMTVTDLLLGCGASIDEINCVRKHLSSIKGGQLAYAAAPAAMLTLVVSDVIGDPLDVIASGPTVPDPTSYRDALAVLRSYKLLNQCPESVIRHLTDGEHGRIPETPKPGELLPNCRTRIIAGNSLALQAARQEAEALGYQCQIYDSRLNGEARLAAEQLARTAIQRGKPSSCLLAGGETTVTLKGSGMGGRNQEFALAAARVISGEEGLVILAAGTDGTDGPTDAAGAIVDGDSIRRGQCSGLNATDCLRDNNSYPFHKASGDLLVTGPTRTNVMDIYLALLASEDGRDQVFRR